MSELADTHCGTCFRFSIIVMWGKKGSKSDNEFLLESYTGASHVFIWYDSIVKQNPNLVQRLETAGGSHLLLELSQEGINPQTLPQDTLTSNHKVTALGFCNVWRPKLVSFR